LTAVRDELGAKMEVHFPVPCGHGGRCPLNSETRDWCNFEVGWNPPPIRRRIERALEHHTGTLRYSYLVVRPGKEGSEVSIYRVISDLLDTREGKIVLLCASGRKIAIKLGRIPQRFSSVLASGRRGDLVKIEGIPEGMHEVDVSVLTIVEKI
jgi:ribosomal protein RSM22 (predicted rRNA methylase)